MGEAKRRKGLTAYHHSSSLVQNRIWMDGVLKPNGPAATMAEATIVQHPKIATGVLFGGKETHRRACRDFPPLVWFTTRTAIPKCMTAAELVLAGMPNNETIAKIEAEMGRALMADTANFYAWNRIALGFPIANIPLVPWRDYHGYDTPEGRDMNESAIGVGDNPDDWYVSEQEIDVMQISEFWYSKSVLKPRLQPVRGYVDDIRRMVAICKNGRDTGADVIIPPAWKCVGAVN